MKILYVNDDPVVGILERALRNASLEAEVVVVKTEKEAREYLARADEIDLVLMDYDLGCGVPKLHGTVASGLVQAFIEAGFGVGKKPLVANSRTNNQDLMEAGCSHECHPSTSDFEYFFVEELRL